jgi:hypothetical protein
MKFADLNPETVEKLKTRRYDRIVEKHEGPWDWKWQIEHGECEFLPVGNHFILLPVYLDQLPSLFRSRTVRQSLQRAGFPLLPKHFLQKRLPDTESFGDPPNTAFAFFIVGNDTRS